MQGRNANLKRFISLFLGFGITTGMLQYFGDGEVNWIALVISTIFFAGIMTFVLRNKNKPKT